MVVGVSGDGERSHRAFAEKFELPFKLLSDASGAVRKAWGVPKMLLLLPGRVTYVLDGEGVVRHVFNDAKHAARHVDEALRVVRGLTA